MRTFYADSACHANLHDKQKNGISFISKQAFKDNIENSDENYRIVGQTKLKEADPDKDNAVLAAMRDGTEQSFRVKDHRMSYTKGYIPVGENEYLKVMAFNPLFLIILLLLLIGIGIALYFLWPREKPVEPQKNRYLEDVAIPERNTDPASTRLRFNTTMTVVQDTIQNLNFENVNEKKQLRITIKLHPDDAEVIYDSGLIPPGQAVTADVLKTHVEPGVYDTIAECFSYSPEGEQQSQTNVEIRLIVR